MEAVAYLAALLISRAACIQTLNAGKYNFLQFLALNFNYPD